MLGVGKHLNYLDTKLDTKTIKTFLTMFGPLAVRVASEAWKLDAPGTGVYDRCPSVGSAHHDHSVLLVGWDKDSNWIIRNSWGTTFGDKGDLIISNAKDCAMSLGVTAVSMF